MFCSIWECGIRVTVALEAKRGGRMISRSARSKRRLVASAMGKRKRGKRPWFVCWVRRAGRRKGKGVVVGRRAGSEMRRAWDLDGVLG